MDDGNLLFLTKTATVLIVVFWLVLIIYVWADSVWGEDRLSENHIRGLCVIVPLLCALLCLCEKRGSAGSAVMIPKRMPLFSLFIFFV